MQWMGLLTAFLATICWALSSFSFTKAGRAMGVPAMNLMRLTVGTILVFITGLLFEYNTISSVFSSNYLQGWLWLGLSGIVALGIGDFLSYRMFTILSPRYGSIFATISPASALLFGMVLINENINFIGITGMAITLGGVISMSFSKKERKNIPDHGHGTVLRGIIFGAIGALCNGIGIVFSKKAFIEQTALGFPLAPLTATFIRIFFTSVLIIIILLLSKNFLKQTAKIMQQPIAVLRVAGMAILLGPLLAVSFAMASIQYIKVAVSQTIFALVPVLALLIAHFIYKEKITRHAFIGVLLAVVGVSILIWRNSITEWLIK